MDTSEFAEISQQISKLGEALSIALQPVVSAFNNLGKMLYDMHFKYRYADNETIYWERYRLSQARDTLEGLLDACEDKDDKRRLSILNEQKIIETDLAIITEVIVDSDWSEPQYLPTEDLPDETTRAFLLGSDNPKALLGQLLRRAIGNLQQTAGYQPQIMPEDNPVQDIITNQMIYDRDEQKLSLLYRIHTVGQVRSLVIAQVYEGRRKASRPYITINDKVEYITIQKRGKQEESGTEFSSLNKK